MQFTKAHGCGNDFIIIDLVEAQGSTTIMIEELRRAAPMVCDRHRGVGADGVLVISSCHADGGARYEMTVINADGSVAEMCGNGLRCVADYLMRRGRAQTGDQLRTGAGDISIFFSAPPRQLSSRERSELSRGSWVGAQLGAAAHLKREQWWGDDPQERWGVSTLSMGNPHAVSFEAELYERRATLAPLLSGRVEGGVNVSFAQLTGAQHLTLHVYERGCGWTQACGTGACATVAVAVSLGLIKTGELTQVSLPGGSLMIEQATDGSLMMWGPAVEVYQGELSL